MFGGNRSQLSPLGFAQAVISTSAVGLPTISGSIPSRARKAYITLEATNGVRWRDDGTNPTAAIGQPIAGGGVLEFEGDLNAFKLIRSGAADATVNVSYYG